MSSEVLDDYEEGTWIPTLGGNATYTTRQGFYTKIGNVVTVTFYLTVGALGTGSNRIISGLPFASTVATGGGAVAYWANISQPLMYISMYTYNSTTLDGYVTGSAVNTLVASSIFGNNATVQACLQYRAA